MSCAFTALAGLASLVALVGSANVEVSAESGWIPRFIPSLSAKRGAPVGLRGRVGTRPAFPEMSLEKGAGRVLKPEAGQPDTGNDLQDLANVPGRVIRSVFKSFDGGSGLLEGEQLTGALQALRLDPTELKKNVFATEAGAILDYDDLAMNYEEFFDAVLTIVTGAPPRKKVLSRRSVAVPEDGQWDAMSEEQRHDAVREVTDSSAQVIRSIFEEFRDEGSGEPGELEGELVEEFRSEGSGLIEGEQLVRALQALRLDPRELQKSAFAAEDGSVVDYKDIAITYDDFYDIVLTAVTGSPSPVAAWVPLGKAK